jgi:hypothetical protein
MDRLNQLKFNPFKFNNDIALCDSNANLDHVLDTNRLKCNYYIPESLNKTQTLNQQNQFSVMCLNIRSISNKFDMFKQLIKSTKENFQIIGLTETWLGDENYKNFNLEGYDFISMHRSGKKGGGV